MDFIEVEACPQHGSTSDRSLPTISACSMFPHHIVVPSIPLTFLLPAKVFTPPGLGGKERMVRAAVLPDRSYHHLMYLPEVSWGDLCTLQRTLTLRPSPTLTPTVGHHCSCGWPSCANSLGWPHVMTWGHEKQSERGLPQAPLARALESFLLDETSHCSTRIWSQTPICGTGNRKALPQGRDKLWGIITVKRKRINTDQVLSCEDCAAFHSLISFNPPKDPVKWERTLFIAILQMMELKYKEVK